MQQNLCASGKKKKKKLISFPVHSCLFFHLESNDIVVPYVYKLTSNLLLVFINSAAFVVEYNVDIIQRVESCRRSMIRKGRKKESIRRGLHPRNIL